MSKRCFFIHLAPVVVATFIAQVYSSGPAIAEETAGVIRITQKTLGGEQTLCGKLLVEAKDGSLLLEDNQQVLHVIPGEDVTHREILDEPQELTPKELGQKIVAELPDGFTFLTTRHYLICYDTSPGYAR